VKRCLLCALLVLVALASVAADGDTYDAVALPAEIEAQLQAICDTIAPEGYRGNPAVLFVGGNAAAKTAAAEFIAQELDRDLYRIDLCQVVSEYISETEENLRRVFDAAERSGVALLFDEADELFGDRSEVRDSDERYANLEILFESAARWDPYAILIICVSFPDIAEDEVLSRFLDVVLLPEIDVDGTSPLGSEQRGHVQLESP